MARALVAVGVPLGRAYELAKRVDQDLVERDEQSTELERVEELAVEVLGEEDGSRGGAAGCASSASCRSSTCR